MEPARAIQHASGPGVRGGGRVEHTRNLVVGAELDLLAVTMAAVLGMARLFAGGGWLGPLTVSAFAAHGLAALLRRRGFSLITAALAMIVGAAVVTTWVSYWSTTRWASPPATPGPRCRTTSTRRGACTRT